jgi:uncharacterized membrane protein
MEATKPAFVPHEFDAATIGALAHLYRGEVYRSTLWRTRLDATTNWAVVTLGIAVSITFSNSEASPLPLLLAGVLCIVFLVFEARRWAFSIPKPYKGRVPSFLKLWLPLIRLRG